MRGLYWALLVSGCGGSDGKFLVVNAAPEGLITSHSEGQEVTAGENVVFAGNGSDTDHASADLNATWIVNDDKVCEGEPVNDLGETLCPKTAAPASPAIPP
jgi:hypothetical protein